MTSLEIYSSLFCPYCYRAKKLLDQKEASYKEIDVTMDTGRRKEMIERAGGRNSVPQIFINGTHIGGCDELYALEANGALEEILKEVS